jgi:hypothetical protein
VRADDSEVERPVEETLRREEEEAEEEPRRRTLE